MSAENTDELLDLIRNRSWMVRHYERGGRTKIGRARRQQAIYLLGLTVREAFNQSDDFEALLTTLVEGLRPLDRPPF